MNKSTKVIVIGLDGATWDLIKPWVKEGVLPNIKKLLEDGVHSELASTLPSSTGPAWTSIITGKNPGKHGIFDFFDLRSSNLRVMSSRDVKSKTLWRILSGYHKSVIVINVPATYPPEKVNGIIITGLLTPSEDSNFTYPRDIREELLRSGYVIEPGIRFVRALSFSPKDKTIDELVNTFNENAEKKAEIAFKLMKKNDWDHLFIVFEGSDRLGHYLWREETFDALKRHYQKLDQIIGRFFKEIPDNTTVIILSDHGMTPIKKKFYVNNWLMNLGVLYINGRIRKTIKYHLVNIGKKSAKTLADLNFPIERILSTKFAQKRIFSLVTSKGGFDTGRTKAYHLTNTSSGIIISSSQNLKKGEYEKLVDHMVRELNEIKDPDTGERILEAFKREELYSGPYVENAPEIMIAMKSGYDLTGIVSMNRKIMKNPIVDIKDSLEVRSANHARMGILIMKGPGIKRGMEIEVTSVYDIVPTILHIMKLPVPSDVDGKVLNNAFVERECSSEEDR